jgi:catechol 2,3-dioxygenase-like lactoylglutathione lyase family enzyme
VGITVQVTDLERSLPFYRDMLGFYEIDGGADSVILASGDTRIVLVTAQELEPIHRRLVHINLEVGDVEAVYQELKIRGIRFTYAPRVVNRGSASSWSPPRSRIPMGTASPSDSGWRAATRRRAPIGVFARTAGRPARP